MRGESDWPGTESELAAQLRKRRDRYEQLVHNMSDLLMLIDPDGTVAFSNRTADLRLSPGGYPGIGTNALRAVVESDRPAVAEALEDILAGRASGREMLFHVRGSNGQARTIEGSLTPVLENGRVVQVELLGRDVTERERSAEALRDANRELRHRQEELQRDLNVAAKIQESLLPPPLVTDRILIDLKHVPLMGVGGDYVHIDRRDPLRPAVAVFDVAGHGIASALVANRVHSAVYATLKQGSRPSEMIRRLNRFVYESFSDLGLFVTLFVMQWDLDGGRGVYCGAGHPPALLRRDGGDEMLQLDSRHLPIGVEPEVFMGPPESAIDVRRGDLIWLYTDGLMELQDSEERMLGVAGLAGRLKGYGPADARPGFTGRCLESILADYAARHDDITLVAAAVR